VLGVFGVVVEFSVTIDILTFWFSLDALVQMCLELKYFCSVFWKMFLSLCQCAFSKGNILEFFLLGVVSLYDILQLLLCFLLGICLKGFKCL
jgi:hypothetical protein